MVFRLLPINPTYFADVFAAANKATLSYRWPLVATTIKVLGFIGNFGSADSGVSEIIMSASGNRSGFANSSLSSVIKSLNSKGFASEAIARETWPPPQITNWGGVVYASIKYSVPDSVLTYSFRPCIMSSKALSFACLSSLPLPIEPSHSPFSLTNNLSPIFESPAFPLLTTVAKATAPSPE